jgi:multiple sugar transport system substrate-binding protein
MLRKRLQLLVVIVLVAAFFGGSLAQAQDPVTFQSTQFNIVEEAEKAREILSGFEGGAEFIGVEEGPLLDLLRAEASSGEGNTDVIGALHGTYPILVNEDLLFDLTDLTTSLDEQYNIADAFVELGKMGTTDYQYYIPWMQATYIMAANVEALEYLPEGADINALTWEQLAEWGANMAEGTGENKLGFPRGGLFHRFLQGYLYPSHTGGMVTKFRSPEAVAMFEFVRDDLWVHVNAESINYEFMQEPLLTGEVWVAFDHTARLIEALNQQPDNFVTFPAPAGPAGRGFMPVIAGLGIPFTSPDPDGAEALIAFMLSPETQSAVLNQLGFFPVVDGVDMSDLPPGVALEAAAVNAQANSPDALPALLPVGLGDRGGEINQIFNAAFDRIVFEGEDIAEVLASEGDNLNTLLQETGAACWPPDAPSDGACMVE